MMGRDWERRPSAKQLLGLGSVRKAKARREWTLSLKAWVAFLVMIVVWPFNKMLGEYKRACFHKNA